MVVNVEAIIVDISLVANINLVISNMDFIQIAIIRIKDCWIIGIDIACLVIAIRILTN